MNRTTTAGALLAAIAAIGAAPGIARAQDEQPVMVEYVAPAPPQCASVQAFQRLVAAEVATHEIERTHWRFAVRIRSAAGGEYVGKATSGGETATARSCDCDKVTAALAKAIAGEAFDPVAPPPASPAPPPPATEAPVPPASLPPTTPPVWRMGARVQTWGHGASAQVFGESPVTAPSYGGMGVISVELPYGLRKTMFEIALGSMTSTARATPAPMPYDSITGQPPALVNLTYYVLDTQTCLLDLPLGAGFSALGCLRVAAASFSAKDTAYGNSAGGALWFGAGGRLRWQSPQSLFLEVDVNAVYGTVSGPEDNSPGWADAGASVGFRL